VQEKYIDAVVGGAQAMPLLIPAAIAWEGPGWPAREDISGLLATLDGLFLTGGLSNVAPAQYGDTPLDPPLPSDGARDRVSLALTNAAIARSMPVFGVCRGMQEINVALGGTLYQQVHRTADFDDHREPAGARLADQYASAHMVTPVAGGVLHDLVGPDPIAVNSLHGQGVDQLAPRLIVDARAPDGLIEAVRGDGPGFLYAVQWHPEWKFRENPVSLALFRAFGNAARAFALSRSK
jgi:putative glutamine amidotransferase